MNATSAICVKCTFTRLRRIAQIMCCTLHLVILSYEGVGQTSPLAQRDLLAARLNDVKDALAGPPGSDSSVWVSDLGILELLGLSGCDTLVSGSAPATKYPRDLRLVVLNDSMFKLVYDVAPPVRVRVVPGTHPLPCALNGMLFHNWARS